MLAEKLSTDERFRNAVRVGRGFVRRMSKDYSEANGLPRCAMIFVIMTAYLDSSDTRWIYVQLREAPMNRDGAMQSAVSSVARKAALSAQQRGWSIRPLGNSEVMALLSDDYGVCESGSQI
jgi:hypothetical protein